MDTTFWGPPGHQLLHAITSVYDQQEPEYWQSHYRQLCQFFKSLGHVLPCIYCRRSFQKYYRELPLKPFARKGQSFVWYYRIHNMINDKLRGQGYLHTPNPTLENVRQRYFHKRFTCFVGWNFLYSTVFHYPTHASELSQRRRVAYHTFFQLLSVFYPVTSYREKYAIYLSRHPVENALIGSRELLKWLYRFERRVNPRCCSFQEKCTRLNKYAVKKCVNKSCRR